MSNVPKLRFKEFRGEWEEKQLGKIATFYNSKRIPLTEIDRIKGEYPYYGASGIIDYVKDYIFDGEYILLGEDGANIVMRNSRLVFLAKGKFWVNNHAHIFQAKDSNSFLCEALERINYTKYNTGTAQPKLNSDMVKKIKLLLPSKQEQEKIALFLSSVDTKIEQLTKKDKLLQEYKKSIMQKIFSQEIRFKADDEREFPEWEEKKLKDITIKKSSNISANTLEENIGQYKIYGATGYLKNVDFYTEDKPYISIVKDGAGVGRVLMCDSQSSVLGTLDIIQNNQKVNLYFVYLLLSRIHFEKYIAGSTIPHIYYKDYSREKVGVPCLDEQTKIANFLSSIDNKIEENQKILEKTKEFKKSLLQQMII